MTENQLHRISLKFNQPDSILNNRSRPKDKDRYGRTVALVYIQDGGCLNQELVRNGFAWAYEQYCHISVCDTW